MSLSSSIHMHNIIYVKDGTHDMIYGYLLTWNVNVWKERLRKKSNMSKPLVEHEKLKLVLEAITRILK